MSKKQDILFAHQESRNFAILGVHLVVKSVNKYEHVHKYASIIYNDFLRLKLHGGAVVK